MRAFLKIILKILAVRVIARYAPTVIAITGSVGKTTTKEAIYAVLHRSFFVWKSESNNNNELGVPMTVLGIQPTLASLFKAIWLSYGFKQAYPKILILELGADRPGDIGYLTDIVRPQIAVITAIGDTPVHVEFYENPAAVAREKAKILHYARCKILNYDEILIRNLGGTTTFGFDPDANIWASDVAYYLEQDAVAGLSFKIHDKKSFVPMRVPGIISFSQIYAILAAFAVGLHLDMNLVQIAGALDHLELPPHRLALVRGIRNSLIIDDTYNASPLSMKSALDTLKQFPGKRKVAILGEMAELGTYAEKAHREVDAFAKANADVVIWCKTSDELLPKIQDSIHDGDIILVKGSRRARMEKIVEELKV